MPSDRKYNNTIQQMCDEAFNASFFYNRLKQTLENEEKITKKIMTPVGKIGEQTIWTLSDGG